MALTIALPLSGLEPEHFYALGARFRYEQGLKSLSGTGGGQAGLGPLSPSSGSETSGFSSLTSTLDTPTTLLTPSASRPSSPEEAKLGTKDVKMFRIVHGGRDVLNLDANIRDPRWQLQHPLMPRHNPSAFMANRSLYYRLGEHGLTEDYPTRSCNVCDFSEPSPLLF